MTLHQLEAQKMARRIQSGELTAEAVLRSCLEKIEAREEVIGAWEHLDSRQALEQAQNLDRKTYRGLLHGVPVGAKDIFDTRDMPTEYGSAIYSGHRPVWDAASIAALRAAGAMILGKTVTTEFAIFHPGKTVNPKAPAHTPGGSSSGSAAAVADDMVPLALGTQTAGSIIRPASYCGVVGYKPTFGLIHRAGVKSISESLDTVGTLTRSVADAALLTTVLAGRPHLHPVAALAQPPRIGLCRTPQWDFAEEATTQAFAQASELVRQACRTSSDAWAKAWVVASSAKSHCGVRHRPMRGGWARAATGWRWGRPASTVVKSAASATLRVRVPTVSRDSEIDFTPARWIRPKVGLYPTTPQ